MRFSEIKIGITNESIVESGKRVIKWLRRGNFDVVNSRVSQPYGLDSNPIKGARCVGTNTAIRGKTVIIGYLVAHSEAEPGEIRLYSTDEGSAEMGYLWLKNNGIIELNGSSDFAVAFNGMKSAFDQLKADHNDLVSKFNAFIPHTHAATLAVSGGSATGVTAPGVGSPGVASVASMDAAKVESVKLP